MLNPVSLNDHRFFRAKIGININLERLRLMNIDRKMIRNIDATKIFEHKKYYLTNPKKTPINKDIDKYQEIGQVLSGITTSIHEVTVNQPET